MNNGDVVIVKVFFSYLNSGKAKRRPVLIIEDRDDTLTFLSLTSKFNEKSAFIKLQYYPIIDWKIVGLDRPSFVDILSGREVKVNLLGKVTPVGEFTDKDMNNLASFIRTYKDRVARFKKEGKQ